MSTNGNPTRRSEAAANTNYPSLLDVNVKYEFQDLSKSHVYFLKAVLIIVLIIVIRSASVLTSAESAPIQITCDI